MALNSPSPVVLQVEPFGGSTRRHNTSLPHLYWDDAAVTRGEGVFETLLIHDGKVANFQRHMKRFQASATQLGLAAPDAQHWGQAAAEAAADWCGQIPGKKKPEAAMTWTLTGGRASTGVPSAWITVRALSDTQLQQREEGVAVMTAERGFSFQISPTKKQKPWVSLAAKSLNYTAAMAALREGRAQGFDDVLWVEGDRVLEGATSSVVIVKKDKRLRSPEPAGEIIAGTAVAALFELGEKKGWRCKYKELSVADLYEAESVWLLSSVRMGARVTRINDKQLGSPGKDSIKAVRGLIEEALTR